MNSNIPRIVAEDSIPDGKILFRSITPFPNFGRRISVSSTRYLSSGTRDGEHYNVYFAYINGWDDASCWDDASSSLLKHWPRKTFIENKELVTYIADSWMRTQFLVIDCLVDDSDEEKIRFNTQTLLEVQNAAFYALLVHHGALGPYIENTWTLRFPYYGTGQFTSRVSMNENLCSSKEFIPATADMFADTFQFLLGAPWAKSQFGRILFFSIESISGSLRALNVAHSLALLAMAFEALFTKKENDFSGGSKRLARIVGDDKAEVNSIHKRLTSNGDCIREMRNKVIHGDASIDYERVAAARLHLAQYVAQAIVFLIQHADDISTGDYYNNIEAIANARFTDLPSRYLST